MFHTKIPFFAIYVTQRNFRLFNGSNCRRICKKSPIFSNIELGERFKYTLASGDKDSKHSKKKKLLKNFIDDDSNCEDQINLENDDEYDLLANTAMHVTNKILNEQKVFIIQPYVKWGPKMSATTPNLKLQEAEALIKSLPKWSIECCEKIPLESLNKRTLFGTGKLNDIKNTIKGLRSNGSNITCIFISKGILSGPQKRFLEQYFGYPVMDRYSVVIQILRLHAKTTESKLQVAMAEIPYIWSQLRDSEQITDKRSSFVLTDTQRQMLRNRERKLKIELANVRSHRELLRNKRKQQNYPVVAVVGYTNSGKTSLIKALTNKESMEPKNQLFATLDVTAHGGILPCKLQVIYIDTVGFMSDLPTGLLECFIATLEDVMLADIVIHVQDVSHDNFEEQRKHVENTLESLMKNSSSIENNFLLKNIINVGNKSDLIKNIENENNEKFKNLKLVSSKNLSGMKKLLEEIEKQILQTTKRIKMIIKVPNGGDEMSWLYKNSAVTNTDADPNNSQLILINVVISEAKLKQFKHYFLYKS